jgi:hypothetical protein
MKRAGRPAGVFLRPLASCLLTPCFLVWEERGRGTGWVGGLVVVVVMSPLAEVVSG